MQFKMLNTLTLLATTTIIGLSALPKPATAQSCSQIEQHVVREIQINSPSIGSSNYLYFWTKQLPSYLSGLQRQYPNCNIYRSGRPSEAAQRNMQRQQESLDNSIRESLRQEGINNMILKCGIYDMVYSRKYQACVNRD